MAGDYKKILTEYYDALIAKHGDGFASMNWGSEEGQRIRFRVLSEIADLRGQSVLDLGCGRGDFSDVLKPFGVQYLGVDLHPKMAEIARVLHPGVKFETVDFLSENLDWSLWEGRWDYVLASGIFPNKMQDNWTYWHGMLDAMWRIARKGLGFNMLSDRLPKSQRVDEEWYTDPADVMDFTLEWTSYSILRHDYKLNDFTVFLYKNPPDTNS